MLEKNTTYSYEEMSAYLGTRNNQGIERKLRNLPEPAEGQQRNTP